MDWMRRPRKEAKNDSNQGSELSNKKNGTAISGDCEGQGWSLAQGKIRSLRWTSMETVQRAKRDGEQAAHDRAGDGSSAETQDIYYSKTSR